jgi:hypothetical protein
MPRKQIRGAIALDSGDALVQMPGASVLRAASNIAP